MELSHVFFGYPGKELFRDLSLTLRPGEPVAVMGPSGGGKTSLLRLMAGLERPRRGRVSGIPREGVSMVFQENRLVPSLTLAENLRLAAPGLSREGVLALLAPLGLGAEADSLPGTLSGGMARRGAIARAAALGSSLCLLDEPFTGLDEENREKAAAFLRERFAGARMAAAVHHREEAELLGARVLRLEDLLQEGGASGML